MSAILKAIIADKLHPESKGGLTLYPATALDQIFDWAAKEGRTLEWVEGVFYRPETGEGQLSLSYMCERRGANYSRFRGQCTALAKEFEEEAARKSMGAYFEIGISS